MMRHDVAIVGAGCVGLSVEKHLAESTDLDGAVLEKEHHLASHQSGRNSGILHPGFNDGPGSTKARFAVEGTARMKEHCAEHDVPREAWGVLVVTQDDREVWAVTPTPQTTGVRRAHSPDRGVRGRTRRSDCRRGARGVRRDVRRNDLITRELVGFLSGIGKKGFGCAGRSRGRDRPTLTRRDALRVGGAAAIAGLAGCSGGISGSGSATVYGNWTPDREGSGADQSGESMRAMKPSTLAENRYALGDRYDLMAAFLEPPVPTMAFGELDSVYYNGGWTSSLYGVAAEFDQSEMVDAYQQELDAETVNSTYSSSRRKPTPSGV